MGAFTCQGCGETIAYEGPGRPRFCALCKPQRYDAVERCPHGISARGRCEPCSWAKAFHNRRQGPRVTGGRRPGLTEAKRRREIEAAIDEAKAARRTEVAAVRALDLDPDERDERVALVREQMRAELADLRAELRE